MIVSDELKSVITSVLASIGLPIESWLVKTGSAVIVGVITWLITKVLQHFYEKRIK